jgi:hypothetical protein
MTAEPGKDRLLLLAELAATTRQIADGKILAEVLG